MTITIRSTLLEATFAPDLGGRMATLRWLGPGAGRDLLVPLEGWGDTPWRWPKAGAYPLFPYSNRIRDARLAHDGRIHPLKPHPDGAPHTVHGPAHLRPWLGTARTADSVTLRLDYAADADWPWPFHAEQTFTVAEDTLSVLLRLTNTGGEAFPAGMGWHPYFLFDAGAAIRHDAATLWVQDDASVATGETAPAAPPQARTEYLSGWSGATLARGDGLRLAMTADPLFAHLVCHRPDSDAYACIEPVSHVADGFNLAARGIAGTGTRVLAPGATLAGRITLRITASR